MLRQRTTLLIISGLMLLLTTACGQGNQFKQNEGNNSTLQSLDEDFSDRTDMSEEELIDLVGQEQILLMDENQVTVNDEGDAGLNSETCDDEDCPSHPSNGNHQGGANIPGLDGLLGGLLGHNGHGQSESGQGGNCGDRDSHTIQIHGPNGTYVGVGPGNVEVSTQNALVCVAPNEVIVAVGDIEGELLNAALCAEDAEAKKVLICQKQHGGASVESCVSKDQVYLAVRNQEAHDKTYLGACQE